MTEIKVRGFHLDFYGHVNNARYLEFLEEGRWDFYGDVITSDFFEQNRLSYVVVNININYKKPVTLHQTLIVETSVKTIGVKSVTLYQKILIKENSSIAADADVTFVILDEKGKALILEDELKRLLIK